MLMMMQVFNAGLSAGLAADNVTGCLPDILQFCEAIPTGPATNMLCPTLAYRRPAYRVPDGTERVCSSPTIL